MVKIAQSLLLVTCLLLSVTISHAQLMDKDMPISPVVNNDNTVTFKLEAPGAESVKISAEFLDGPRNLASDDGKIWSVTLGPIEPDIYWYMFNVDGLAITDPDNIFLHSSYNRSSLVLIPGVETRYLEERTIPHGDIHYHRYHSDMLGDNRGMYVYTPPGYSRNTTSRYPVLYLLHGYTDQEDEWMGTGRAQFIIDNLIADDKAEPMIIVMPNGYVPPHKGDNAVKGDPSENWKYWFSQVTPRFDAHIVNEVIPFIDSSYRTKKDSHNRAVAGLSMGGGQTLYLGLKHPDLFGWVCAFSSAVYNDVHGQFLSDTDDLNEKLDLLWIGCGTDDFLYGNNTDFVAFLKAKNVHHVTHFTGGVHTWRVWRPYLYEVMQQLF